MSTDPRQTSFPGRRESTAPDREKAESCMDPRLRAGGASSTRRGDDGSATLSRLMIWLSPAYPVGGYSYSHGLEWAVEAGQVTGSVALACWIEDLLMHGAGRTDIIFLAEAWRAMTASDTASLGAVAELA